MSPEFKRFACSRSLFSLNVASTAVCVAPHSGRCTTMEFVYVLVCFARWGRGFWGLVFLNH